MISMIDDASVASALQQPLHPELIDLIRRRRAILGDEIPFADMAHFIIVEPGDTIDEIELIIRWPIRPDPDCGLPQWEWVLVHDDVCWETVIVTDDAGFAIVIFVPMAEGVDQELTGLLRAFCT